MAIDQLVAPDQKLAKAFWDHETDDELVCLDIHDETHDVKSFTFISPQRKQFAFSAGQYFLFEPGLETEDDGRCYSISSSPWRSNAITITVKRVPGGRISNWFHDELKPGTLVKASGPLGRFVRPAARKFFFISGGSGITPVMSMLRDLADQAEPVDVAFLHAARTPRDFVFCKELSAIASRLKGLRLHLLPEHVGDERCWPGLTGRISKEYLSLAVPDLAERVVMCCGPAPFMAAARTFTAELGVPASNYLEESFDAAVVEDAPSTADKKETPRSFEVRFSKQGRTIDVPADQTVLSCAKRAGLRIPSSCANGICGTCKSKLVSGTVDMRHEGGIRQREIDTGLFLPCCSRPLSDLVIDR
jgi:glycine betaine catabolism B